MASAIDEHEEHDTEDRVHWLDWLKWILWLFVKCLFKFFTGVILVFVCAPPNAEGLRVHVPVFGTRLHQLPIPGLSNLRHYEGLQRLDCAHLAAVGLLLAVWYVLVQNIWILLAPDEYFARTRWDPAVFTKFMRTVGIVVVGADALIFYAGVSEQMGGLLGGAGFSMSAVLVTIAYVGVTILVSFISVVLDRK